MKIVDGQFKFDGAISNWGCCDAAPSVIDHYFAFLRTSSILGYLLSEKKDFDLDGYPSVL